MRNQCFFVGLDGMQQVSIIASGSNVLGGNTTCLFLESMIQIYNPTIATVEVDSVSLNLYTSNTFVGVAIINNFVLVPGQNTISGSVTWINTSPTVSQNFFSNWLQGKKTLQSYPIYSKFWIGQEYQTLLHCLGVKLQLQS